MKKEEKIFLVFPVIFILLMIFIRKFNFCNLFLLSLYELCLLLFIIFIPVYFIKGKEKISAGLQIVTWCISLYCFLWNSFILLFTISLTTGNFHQS